MRRILLALLTPLLCLPVLSTPQSPADDSLVLWYKQPTTRWGHALALGNGRLGAMVFGGTARERIGLNEDTVWSGGPYEPSTEVTRQTRDEIKRLMFEGKFREAQNLSNKLQGTPNTQASYQTIGELHLFPAFPFEKWPAGTVKGLRARGGIEVDLAWAGGKLTTATLRSVNGAATKIRYNDNVVDITLKPGATRTLGGTLR